jgi:hypothetical protein
MLLFWDQFGQFHVLGPYNPRHIRAQNYLAFSEALCEKLRDSDRRPVLQLVQEQFVH